MTAIHELKDFLLYLGFIPEEGKSKIWSKSYSNHNNYRISLDFNAQLIEYGSKIILGDRTTCNFKVNENFVVLECVNRLLEKGYPPESLVLEKDYPLGHKMKGKLDVLVNDPEDKAYLMVECKVWGTEYEKAAKKTLTTGGQLLSYFQQDTSAKYLCLYTSRYENKRVEYINGIIKVEPEFLEADNINEVFEQWNKNLKDNGIFETDSAPYNILIKSLTKDSLKPLTKDDSSRIFNQFAEILRHNVVSDKPNAFNKLITLLLCKIVDEDRADDEELHFQWLENDTNIELQKRLNDLYKVGMEKYLTKVVTDYSDKDVEDIVGLDETQKDIIKKMMTELRLKKNNEFAFKEVFNDDSFEENSRVLKEVVELFQPYQVRYNKKQQFLGDFFELLLNTSIKQEAGQFFTPVPIARFIINSLPIKELILQKISQGDNEFLPYVIDYAVGSGHFLTEVMDEIHTIIRKLNEKDTYKPSIKKSLSKWADDYDWAYDFIYGIEKDYRLVKTAKVSCFLNGDGLARIFNADGLANFESDKDYRGKLEIFNKANPKDNQQFEILIANPPYSVSAFKNTLINGEKSFDLYNRLTDDSSEIECLFIERTKQLLKDGGYAGIILPSSILSNTGIYEDAREIILKYFKIVAIAEFGSNTFMATGTNTVTLFLQRRSNSDWQKIEHAVNQFFINKVDVTVNGIENIFSKYIIHVYKSISIQDYVSLIQYKPNNNISSHDLFAEYKKAFYNSTPVKNLIKRPAFKKLQIAEQQTELNKLFIEDTIKKEKEKLLFFILTYSQQTLLIKANPDGKNETEKEFLGYEFSNRRGHEGIKPYGALTIAEATKLYEYNVLNPEKANTYIYQAFLSEDTVINENLEKHIIKQKLVDMMDWSKLEFTKDISLALKKKVDIETKWQLKLLGNICNIKIGGTPSRQHSEYYMNGIYLWVSISEMNGSVITDTKEKINELGIKKSNVKLIKQGSTLLSFKLSIGKTAIAGEDLYTNEAIAGLEIKDELREEVINEYLFYMFNSKIIDLQKSDNNAFGKSLNSEDLKNVKIPIPDINIQKQLVKEIQLVENNEHELLNSLNNLKAEITDIANNVYQNYPLVNLGSVCEKPQYGANESAIKGNPKTDHRYIRITDIDDNGTLLNDWKTAKKVEDQYILNDGDFLFARSGATVGKTFLYSNDSGKALFAGYLIRFVTKKDKLLPQFLDVCVKSNRYKSWVQSIQRKAAQPNINGQEYSSFQIPLPSILEQENIVAEIEKIEKQIEKLKKELSEIPKEKNEIVNKYLN